MTNAAIAAAKPRAAVGSAAGLAWEVGVMGGGILPKNRLDGVYLRRDFPAARASQGCFSLPGIATRNILAKIAK